SVIDSRKIQREILIKNLASKYIENFHKQNLTGKHLALYLNEITPTKIFNLLLDRGINIDLTVPEIVQIRKEIVEDVQQGVIENFRRINQLKALRSLVEE